MWFRQQSAFASIFSSSEFKDYGVGFLLLRINRNTCFGSFCISIVGKLPFQLPFAGFESLIQIFPLAQYYLAQHKRRACPPDTETGSGEIGQLSGVMLNGSEILCSFFKNANRDLYNFQKVLTAGSLGLILPSLIFYTSMESYTQHRTKFYNCNAIFLEYFSLTLLCLQYDVYLLYLCVFLFKCLGSHRTSTPRSVKLLTSDSSPLLSKDTDF